MQRENYFQKVLHISILCFKPEKCSNCDGQEQLEILPGDENIAVVNKDGRFDLKSAKFFCSYCKLVTKASIIDYICSGY
ncbi:hypothetical protein OUZ56_033360 [Daphnia magna]|uniref:CxC3 like cysteine cluster domain-containing protein n=1 Tax=Daphnia magna TaxID=35525 RepID=A0ABQ9ZXN7_9CRUS|nr:hypothetical protein OUZ56_033360 [Daphnia magna]